MATITQALNLALQHHRAGRLDLAEQIYRRILAAQPDQADAWHLLGTIARDTGQHAVAIEYIGRAIALNPLDADYHNNLGIAFKEQGNLGEAIACYQRALQLRPDFVEADNNLGNALLDRRQPDRAVDCYRRVLQLKPDFVEAHNNLGNVLRAQGRLREAIECYQRALQRKPDFVEAHNNLGIALKEQGNLNEAIGCYQRALELRPHDAGLYNNLGNAWKELGRLDEAVACYRRALELKPDYVLADSNLVYVLLFCPECDAQAIYEAARRWNERHAEPLARYVTPHRNERSGLRRLRIGYVSPDFRDHVAGRNVLPLLREHDQQQFDVFCYADVAQPDRITERFLSYADTWRNIVGLSDEQVAEWVRQDEVDILVDLTLHTAGSRLLLFARKPAPVQATFAGYPGTTGLSAIDYRLTDPYLDPPGSTTPLAPCGRGVGGEGLAVLRQPLNDAYYAEQSIRLRDSFWCYDPLSDEPAVGALPALEKRYVTFGCLNNFCKVNPPVLKLWAQVLKGVDHSRLILRAEEGVRRQRTLDLLAQEGIVSDRVTFVSMLPRLKYLQVYQQIDIGLDTFPYNGHTTSLDSFWMGVPVVTLIGQTVVGRAGWSQLTNLGLCELAAETAEQFVRIATGLATDLPRLTSLRATLRDRMQQSPLMDAPRFARSIETAYRAMWQRWCTK